MDHVRLFLKTPFFDPGRRGSISAPYAKAMVLEGAVSEAPGGLRVSVTAWWDGDGAPLTALGPLELVVPLAKIDHLVVLDGSA